jgi:hypothetical protein
MHFRSSGRIENNRKNCNNKPSEEKECTNNLIVPIIEIFKAGMQHQNQWFLGGRQQSMQHSDYIFALHK